MMEDNLEINRLRNELARAKLELYNRESNFNRVFSEKQPVLVNDSHFVGTQKNSKVSFVYQANLWFPLNFLNFVV